MRKTVTLLIGAASVAALLAITACKQFLADIDNMLCQPVCNDEDLTTSR